MSGDSPMKTTTPPSTTPKKAKGRKCRIRIQLPDSTVGSIETVVRDGEDLLLVSKRIASEYKLSMGFQQKVYDQLRATFK